MPGEDCDGVDDNGTGFPEIMLIAITGAASIGCVAAAGLRVVGLGRGREDLSRQLWLGAGAAVLLVFVSSLPMYSDNGPVVTRIFVFGIGATALALLSLVVTWLAGRKPDDVGILLPLYLLGAGLFVYPAFTLLALAIDSGALC